MVTLYIIGTVQKSCRLLVACRTLAVAGYVHITNLWVFFETHFHLTPFTLFFITVYNFSIIASLLWCKNVLYTVDEKVNWIIIDDTKSVKDGELIVTEHLPSLHHHHHYIILTSFFFLFLFFYQFLNHKMSKSRLQWLDTSGMMSPCHVISFQDKRTPKSLRFSGRSSHQEERKSSLLFSVIRWGLALKRRFWRAEWRLKNNLWSLKMWKREMQARTPAASQPFQVDHLKEPPTLLFKVSKRSIWSYL